MKRTILLTALALPIAACEPTAQNAQQEAASEKFDKAFAVLDVSTTGARHVKREPDSPLIHDYQTDRINQAAEHVKDLTTTGRSHQQFAARKLVAEAHAAAARNAWHEGSTAWARQNPLAAQLTSTASGLSMATVTASEQGKVNFDDQIIELRGEQQTLADERDSLNREIAQLQNTVTELQGQVDAAEQVRKKQTAEASKLERKAFQSAGQLRYDLTVQAAAASRKADEAAAEAALASAKLDVAEARLKVAQAEFAALEARIEQNQEAVDALQQRGQKVSEMTSQASSRADELATTFDAMLKQFVQQQDAAVNQPLATAAEEYQNALEQLEAAKNAASSDAAALAEIAEASMRAEFGHMQHKAALIHSGYRGVLNTIGTTVASTKPEQAQAIEEVAQAALDRADNATAAARQALTNSGAALQQITDNARSSGDQKLERAALRQLITIKLALASLNGDDNFKAQAQEHQARLNELQNR